MSLRAATSTAESSAINQQLHVQQRIVSTGGLLRGYVESASRRLHAAVTQLHRAVTASRLWSRIGLELVLTPRIGEIGSAAALVNPLLFDLPAASCCCHGDGALVLHRSVACQPMLTRSVLGLDDHQSASEN